MVEYRKRLNFISKSEKGGDFFNPAFIGRASMADITVVEEYFAVKIWL